MSKYLKGSRKLGSLVAAVNHRSPTISALYPHLFSIDGSKEEFIPGAGTPISVQGYQPNLGKDHVFETTRARDMERHFNNDSEVVSLSAVESQNAGEIASEAEVRESECYQPSSNVSLYSVMQTNVPEPYSNHGKPSHFNMPGGNMKLDEKYTSSKLNSSHPSRNYNTLASNGPTRDKTNTINLSGLQKLFPTRRFSTSPLVSKVQTKEVDNDIPIPAVITPEEENSYIAWMEKNKLYYLDYSEQYNALVSGEKSLKVVVAEQEAVIADIAGEYEKRVSEDRFHYEGVQGDISPQAWLKNHTVASLSAEDIPYPQGVQGLNCEHFKVWLDNCTKYHFVNCDDQLKDVQEGRKTLGQIFEEQEQIIKQVAEDYKAGHGNPSGQVGNNPQETVKLSQKEKLKRAVKEYGSTVIVFHVAISLVSLGGFYLAVSSGIDVVGLLGKLGVGQSILESRLAAGTGTFVVAYAVHKVFAPARIGITLTCTPLIVRYLRRVGFLKSPKVKV